MEIQFCSYCGGSLKSSPDWPKICLACQREHYRNPAPVAVVVVPVDKGVLTVRRDNPPGKGKLALPGGFINWGESWQDAAAREVFEEVGIRISPEEVELLHVETVPEGAMLLFCQARPRLSGDLIYSLQESEVSEVVVLDAPAELAFGTHTAILAQYFKRR